MQSTKPSFSTEQRAQLEEFKAFLRIRSISHEGPFNGAYAEAVAWLKGVAEEIGLKTKGAHLTHAHFREEKSWTTFFSSFAKL
jgi:hypothetical protein